LVLSSFPLFLLSYAISLRIPWDIRFHDLRHSAATLLLSMGISAKVVQEILGHSNFSTTMDRYSHVLPSMQQEAMNKMDDFFRQQP